MYSNSSKSFATWRSLIAVLSDWPCQRLPRFSGYPRNLSLTCGPRCGGPRVRGAALKLRRRLNPSVPITHEPTSILAPTDMSQTHPPVTSSSNFQLIFDNALKAYRKRTKKDLLSHPLATQLQECDSPSSIRAVLRRQVQEIDQSQTDDRLTGWLDPTVNVLSALSDTIGDAVGLVCSHT